MLSLISYLRFALLTSILLVSACQQLPEQQQAPSTEESTEASAEQPAEESCQCEQVAAPEPLSCPEPSAAPSSTSPPPPTATPAPRISKIKTVGDLLLIGRLENILVSTEKLKLKARIDTGAGLSSLHANNLTEFERDGESWVKFSLTPKGQETHILERPVERYISIKQHTGEPQRRPVVFMRVTLGPIDEQIEMSLTDRSDYLYQALIGRNFLRDRAIVDVSNKFLIKLPKR